MNAIIETDRIILRQFTQEDAQAVFEFGSDAEIQKYTGDETLKSIQEAEDKIREVFEPDYKKYGYGRWATIYKPDHKLIGFTGLKYLPELDATDIGFRYLPQYWGKGIGTEASRESVKYGFEVLKLERIIGIAMPENVGSCRVLEKSGLTFYKQDYYDGHEEIFNWYEAFRKDYSKR